MYLLKPHGGFGKCNTPLGARFASLAASGVARFFCGTGRERNSSWSGQPDEVLTTLREPKFAFARDGYGLLANNS
jgi:hypothetical protein